MRKCFGLTLCVLLALPCAVRAQSPKPTLSPSPSASAKPAADRSVSLVPSRPGSYSYWAVGKAGQGTVAVLGAGDKSANLSLPADATAITVMDETSGTVAVYSAEKMKTGDKVTVAPADFKFVRAVQVSVTAGGKPVEKASVSLTDSAGQTNNRVLSGADNGIARFENVALGKATVQTSYGADGPKATQEIPIAPAKGGGPIEIPLTLAGNVPTLDKPAPNASATPSAPIAPVPAPTNAESAPNNWLPGIVGMGVMAGLIVYGLKQLKARNVTVPDVLEKMGVEMPQDASESALPKGYLKPAPAPLPPLPSLSELPSAGAAPASARATLTAPPVLTGVPRLIGLTGTVSGETFTLDANAPLTVGRDLENTLALSSDTTASRRHARFERGASGTWSVADNGSSNGTFVNGARVTGTQALSPGDEIQVGAARFRYEG